MRWKAKQLICFWLSCVVFMPFLLLNSCFRLFSVILSITDSQACLTLAPQGTVMPSFTSVGWMGQWVEHRIIHGVDTDRLWLVLMYLISWRSNPLKQRATVSGSGHLLLKPPNFWDRSQKPLLPLLMPPPPPPHYHHHHDCVKRKRKKKGAFMQGTSVPHSPFSTVPQNLY